MAVSHKQEAIEQELVEQEATGHESMEQELIEQESIELESTEQETTEQESNEQESTEQESTEQESTEQESTEQESTEQETTEQETTEQESTEQETTEQESTEQESNEQESTEQESNEKESTEQEITERESTEQESTEQESNEQESTEQESNELEAVELEATELEATEHETTELEATEHEGIVQTSFEHESFEQESTEQEAPTIPPEGQDSPSPSPPPPFDEIGKVENLEEVERSENKGIDSQLNIPCNQELELNPPENPEIQNLKTLLQNTQEKVTGLENELKIKDQAIERSNGKFTTQIEENQSLRNQLISHKENILQLQEIHQKLKESHQKSIDDNKNQKDFIQMQEIRYSKKVGELSNQTKEAKESQVRLKNMEEVYLKMKGELESYKSLCRKYEGDHKYKDYCITLYKDDLMSVIEIKLKQKYQDENILLEENCDLKTKNRGLLQDKSHLEEQNRYLQQDKSRLEEKVRHVLEETSDLKEENRDLLEEKSNLEEKNRDLQRSLLATSKFGIPTVGIKLPGLQYDNPITEKGQPSTQNILEPISQNKPKRTRSVKYQNTKKFKNQEENQDLPEEVWDLEKENRELQRSQPAASEFQIPTVVSQQTAPSEFQIPTVVSQQTAASKFQIPTVVSQQPAPSEFQIPTVVSQQTAASKFQIPTVGNQQPALQDKTPKTKHLPCYREKLGAPETHTHNKPKSKKKKNGKQNKRK